MLAIPEYKILFVHIHKNAGKSVKGFLRRSRLKALKKASVSARDGKPGIFQRLRRKIFAQPEALPVQKAQVFVREWKGQKVYGHESLYNLLCKYPEFESYFKLAVVRNPWDRLVSAYFWIKGKPSGSSGLNRDNLTGIENFEHFVRVIYQTFNVQELYRDNLSVFHHPETLIEFSGPRIVYPGQTAYLADKTGRILTDAIVRQERLGEDLERVLGPVLGLEPAEFPDLRRAGPSSRPPDYMSQYNDETRQMAAEIYAPDIELFGYEFGRGQPPASPSWKALRAGSHRGLRPGGESVKTKS